jgi:hypothetical protein
MIVLAMLFSLAVLGAGSASAYAKLPCLLLGHCESCSVLRMRAGAAVTTREERNGRLANRILREDSAVYQSI